MKENNEILKDATASESFSERVDDIEERDKSVQEREKDNVTKIIIADQLKRAESFSENCSSDRSRREINMPEKVGGMIITKRRQCQRTLRNIIDKREQRRDELDKMEGDLRQRLGMLECSIPAVMVWNIWKKSQGSPVCKIKRILEKQFKDAKELTCRSTPSCHYDCRIREIEAERKLALKKVEKARTLWSEKLATLEERKRKLDEARRIQEEQKSAIERLNEEAKVLREAMEKEELCQCGDTQCKHRHLDKISSLMSVESGDIRCLERLQRLAEEEVIAKREIAELERREEAYMKTLQHADELWSKMEGDAIGATNGLQEQLDVKMAANQELANRVCKLEDELEICQARLAACRTELGKFQSIEKVEATTGRDDDIAKVEDKGVAARARMVHRSVGREDDVATVKDSEVLAKIEVADAEALVKVDAIDTGVQATVVVSDKLISVKPDLADFAVDRPTDLVQIEDVGSVVRPEDFAYEQKRFEKVREYLSQLESLEELYENDGEPCAPDFVCNDVVSSPTDRTDEELTTLSEKYTVPTETYAETVNDEEHENQFQKESERQTHYVINNVKEEEERDDGIPGAEVKRKVVENVEKRVVEIDVPVKEIVTPPTIEDTAHGRLVTMPKNQLPEVNKIETAQDIVIKRETILSWIDAIDEIRTTAAKHPDCREVEKDADILAEKVGTYVGIKSEKAKEESAAITTENKLEEVNGKNEEETTRFNNENLIHETKLQDELMILRAEEMEPATKTESSTFPKFEKTSAEVKSPTAAIAESELPSTLTKEEAPIGIKSPTAVSIEDSFQSPTIRYKENLKDDMILLTVPELHKPDIEMETEKTQIDEIVQDTKETETSKNKGAKRIATVEDRANNKLVVNVIANGKTVNADKETLDISKIDKKESEVVLSNMQENEKDKDISRQIKNDEVLAENKKAGEVLPEMELDVVEMPKKILLNETKITDIKETIPHTKSIKTNETVNGLPVSEMAEKVEQEKTILAMDVGEVKEIMPEAISPTDIIKVEKLDPDKFPIADVEKASTANAVEEKFQTDEPTPVSDVEEKKSLLNTITSIKEIEIEEPIVKKEEIKVTESTVITNTVKEEQIEITEMPSIEVEGKKEDIKLVIFPPILGEGKEVKIDTTKSPLIMNATEKGKAENTEMEIESVGKKEVTAAPNTIDTAEEKKFDADVTVEAGKKTEKIEPVLAPSVMKKEIKEALETTGGSALKVEIKKEKDEEPEGKVTLSEKVTSAIELLEKEKKEETPPGEKERILAEMPPSKKPPAKDGKEVPLEEKKPEVLQIELKIPIAEIKSTEMEMQTIPLEPQLVAQPYLIIAKFKEKEVLQMIPAKQPCAGYCLQSPIKTAEPSDIPQIDSLQSQIIQTEMMRTKIMQGEVIQTKVVQTEAVQTEVAQTETVEAEFVQITAQTLTAAEPPRAVPIRIITEYLKPTELKASRTEIAGDHPEITGRKMLWRKRLEDQSTVTTGSQTDKTSHVSHDRVIRDERERARVPTDELLRTIKIAARLAQPDTEREIRAINYGGRSEAMRKATCNCCLCGRIPTSPLTEPRLEFKPQTSAKTATPPAVAAFERMFIRPKIDYPISHDRLCHDCKAKIQSKMPRKRHHLEKIIKTISRDPENCGFTPLVGKSCHAPPRKRAIGKRDQACLDKLSKQIRTDLTVQKKKDDIQSILEDSENYTVEPLSPSCICFKLDKIGDPIKKGNCHCAD